MVLVDAYWGVISTRPIVPSKKTIRVQKQTIFQRLRRMRNRPERVWLSDSVPIPDALVSAVATERDATGRLLSEELGVKEFIIWFFADLTYCHDSPRAS